jgi:hypothetical protein
MTTLHLLVTFVTFVAFFLRGLRGSGFARAGIAIELAPL